MAVFLSPVFNGFQGFTVNGIPSAGGLLNTYQAGTTTPAATYTTNAGSVANANPIVLDASGHPPFEIWLTGGQAYKFVVTDALGLNPYTYDNITGVGDGSVTTITAGSVTYTAPYTGAVTRTQQSKDQDVLSVKDFGAVGNGSTDDTVAINAAIAAGISLGQAVYFPAPSGTYLISSALNVAGPVRIYGDGYTSQIRTNSASANVFNITGANIWLSGLRITGSVTQTGGWRIQIASTSSHIYIDHMFVDGWLQGLQSSAIATISIDTCEFINGINATGIALRFDNNSVDTLVRNTLIEAVGGGQLFAGIYITACGDLQIDNCQVLTAGDALYLNPGAGQTIASIWATSTFFDTGVRGLYAQAAGGTIVRCTFNQCWFSSHVDQGVLLQTSGGGVIDGMYFDECEFFLNGADGFYVADTGSINVRVSGGSAAQNTLSGYHFGGGVNAFSVQGVRSGAGDGLTANIGAGVTVDSGASTNYTISDNDLRNNTGGALVDGGTGTKSISGNIGFSLGILPIGVGSGSAQPGQAGTAEALVAASGVLNPAYSINGGLVLVRDVTGGGVALFLIDATGTGSVKVGGSASIVLGAPGASQLGVNSTTGAVTNGYVTSRTVALLNLTAQ